jgi:hypothetical protein
MKPDTSLDVIDDVAELNVELNYHMVPIANLHESVVDVGHAQIVDFYSWGAWNF